MKRFDLRMLNWSFSFIKIQPHMGFSLCKWMILLQHENPKRIWPVSLTEGDLVLRTTCVALVRGATSPLCVVWCSSLVRALPARQESAQCLYAWHRCWAEAQPQPDPPRREREGGESDRQTCGDQLAGCVLFVQWCPYQLHERYGCNLAINARICTHLTRSLQSMCIHLWAIVGCICKA